MSLSGNDVLALIERMHTDTRGEVANVDTRLARFTADLETLRQRELGVLSVLARIRMREIEGGELKAALDETGRRVKELLGQREGALAAVGEELAAAERQQAALEQERAAQQAVVDAAEKAVDEAEAAAQQALGADAAYRAKLEAAAASDNVADSAEAKATAAQADRTEKGKPYEADPLFSYLWGRGFGTTAYAHGGLTRALDGWVARVARFEPLRRDYWLLTELPGRFDEHAKRMRAQADADLGSRASARAGRGRGGRRAASGKRRSRTRSRRSRRSTRRSTSRKRRSPRSSSGAPRSRPARTSSRASATS